jgi:NTP pyrophosphatase (non-canonical NTP hydrolase)
MSAPRCDTTGAIFFHMMNQAKQVVTEVANGGKKLRVIGYVNTAGEKRDLEVELIGPAGYRDLVRASVAWLEKQERPDQFAEKDWDAGKFEQWTSWTNTLNGDGSGRREDNLKYVAGTGYATRDDRPEAIVVTGLKNLLPREPVSLDKCRTPVTAVKKWLQANAPVGDFMGNIILEPGKFERVESIAAAPPRLTLQEFQPLTERTESPSEVVFRNLSGRTEVSLRLMHAALGLTSEASEILESTDVWNLREELGDAFWFACLGLNAIDAKVDPLETYLDQVHSIMRYHEDIEPAAVNFAVQAGDFANHVKALVYGNKATVKVDGVAIPITRQLEVDLFDVLVALVRICTEKGFEVEEVLATNKAKLRARYPDRYTDEAFANRDKVKEQAAMASTAS